MISIKIQDNRSREDIELSYNPETGIYYINGKKAERQAPLESRDDEYVYSVPEIAPEKLFHISADEFELLRNQM